MEKQAHQRIAKLEENLWTVDGDIRLPGGIFTRKMTLMKLRDGRVAIHSAIMLDEAGMAEIERWGEPTFAIVPNRHHRLDAPALRQRYPAIKIICPGAARVQVEKVLRVDGEYETLPEEITWRALATKDGEAAFMFRSGERVSIIFGDVLFNVEHFGGALGWTFRMIGSTGEPRVTPLAKWAVVADKRELARQLRELAGTASLVRLIPGHGENIEKNPSEILSAVAEGI